MREIKFRAWDKEYKKMMEWGKQLKGLTQNGIKTVMSYNSEDGWSDCYNLKDIDLMQYTGLKDKNGKEIYEGDIVLYKHASYKDISRVLYHKKEASFVMEAIKEDDNTSMARFKKGTIRGFVAGRVNGYDYVKVIGNIYDNPELLEID